MGDLVGVQVDAHDAEIDDWTAWLGHGRKRYGPDISTGDSGALSTPGSVNR